MQTQEYSVDAAAAAQRLTRGVLYFHGVPCRAHGHTLRYTLTRSCVECVRVKARAVTTSKQAALVRLGLR